MFSFSAQAAVVAKIGGRQITDKEFRERYEQILKASATPPSADKVLNEMVRFELGLLEAEKQKIDQEREVSEQINLIRFNALLKKQLGDQLTKIKVTEADMRKEYEKFPEIRVAHILFDESEAALAADVFKKIKNHEISFEEAVQKYSHDSLSKKTFGDLGPQTKFTLLPTLYDRAAKLGPGELAGPIETRYGIHLLRMLERQPFDKADKYQVQASILEGRRAVVLDRYFDGLKKNWPVQVDQKALESVVKQ